MSYDLPLKKYVLQHTFACYVLSPSLHLSKPCSSFRSQVKCHTLREASSILDRVLHYLFLYFSVLS